MGQSQSRKDNNLIEACYKNDSVRFEKLIKNGADIKAMENYGQQSLLSFAIKNYCDYNIIKLLIENGANLNINIYWHTIRSTLDLYSGGSSASLLGYAIIERLDLIEILLSYNIDVNMKDINGKTPLEIAVEYARVYDYYSSFPVDRKELFERKDFIIELLISKGAELTNKIIDLMLSNGMNDLCLKVIQKKAFDRRKHLIECYYSYSY